MKTSSFNIITTLLFGFTILFSGCGDSQTAVESTLNETPTFNIGVKAMDSPTNWPYLQSFALAQSGDEILLIGGRTEGFHGFNELDTIFKTTKANTAIWVINLATLAVSKLELNLQDSLELPFCYSNMQFYQSGDTLYLNGGYGPASYSDSQSNITNNKIYAIGVSEMINQVKNQGKVSSAIIDMASSPFVQVTGGELIYEDGWFYLLFGQNYSGAYAPGVTGAYTSAIRTFRFSNGQIQDTSSIADSIFYRRDLNVVKITQKSGDFYAGFGGVFNSLNNGFLNPVYVHTNQGSPTGMMDTLEQKTSQYACANISIYDPNSDACITVLLGGIGRYQYDAQNKSWEDGDNHALLPFVKTITQMKYQNGKMEQYIQLPPDEPDLPNLIGANAIFLQDMNLIYKNQTIDYSKITGDTTKIGLMYGGIFSPKPTSSSIYPTTLNKTIYEVFLYR